MVASKKAPTRAAKRLRSNEMLRLLAAGAHCLLWQATVIETGQPWLQWEMQVFDEEAAQQFFPLDVAPPELPYSYAWHLSKLEEDRLRMDAFAVQEVRAGRSYTQEFRCRRKDGAVRWLKEEVQIEPLAPGRWRATGVCMDITERKHAEVENQRLLREVQEAAVRQLEAAAWQRAFLRDVLASVTEGKLYLCDVADELPPRLSSAGAPIALTATEGISSLRHRAQDAASSLDFPEERWQDLGCAVSEAAMNAVVHAGGGQGQVCVDSNGTVQIWIQDAGTGIAMEHLPRATLERGYSTVGTLGHGFWLMLNTVDRLWLLTGSTGTTVVLEQDRTPPELAWL